MGHQGHNSRRNEPQAKRARVAQPRTTARKSNGYDDTNRAPHPTQQSRSQQHQQPRLPQDQVATAPGSAPSGQQPEDFAYDSQPSDGTDMQDVDDISEASLRGGGHDAGLAAAVMALSRHVQTNNSHAQTNNTLLQRLLDELTTSNQHTGELRAATRINTNTVKIFLDFLKLNNMPQVSAVQGYDGTFTHRNLPPGPPRPPDQGGTGQFPSNGFIQ
ncbi:hypothetical protein ARSEF4850_009461 [Beauveria asiatica]